MSIEKAILAQYSDPDTDELSFALSPQRYACRRCGALVPVSSLALHVQWHEKLRRAIEEGDFRNDYPWQS